MKHIVACDGRGQAAFLSRVERVMALEGAEVLFAHVVDEAFEEGWRELAGHHWLGRQPGPREGSRFKEAVAGSASEILEEAMALSSHWPAAVRRPVELRGNPERRLVRLALAEEVDTIVVGQHRIELGPGALGRCARFVVDHAPCAVLLVRDEGVRQAATSLLGRRLDEPPKARPR